MTETKKSSRIWEFLLIFALVYLLSDFAFDYFAPKKDEHLPPVTVVSQSRSFRRGHHPVLIIKNNTDQPLPIENRCPMPPVEVFRVDDALVPLTTTETAVPCETVPPVPAMSEAQLSLAPWKYSLFDQPGEYEVRLPIGGDAFKELLRTATGSTSVMVKGDAVSLVTRFSVHELGFIVKAFRTFITKPFLNFLVLTASFLPDYNLGIAIIILTLLVKLLLYFPTQHAMEGQRKMQVIQPRLQELQRRLKDDPKKLHEETLKLWRQEGVNPFQSCLPILLQFPILIGLFFVIRDGSHLPLSREFLYAPYSDLPWTFGTDFLSLDLTKASWIFPPLLVALQFLQMKLSFAAAKKRKPEAEMQDKSQKMQQNMMLYTMPLLIGFFAFQFPGAVSLYWAVSTVFAIGQQIVANRKVG